MVKLLPRIRSCSVFSLRERTLVGAAVTGLQNPARFVLAEEGVCVQLCGFLCTNVAGEALRAARALS
jgi:hypothetical protein